MATSDLYKIGRLVNTDTFVVRVSAAMLLQAQSLLGSSTGNPKNMAVGTLLKPMGVESSMVALAAADPAILAQVTLDGPVAVLDNLLDADIKRVVAAKWNIVAAKYPADPTPAAAAAQAAVPGP